MTAPASGNRPSWLERALAPITEVRRGEAPTALLLTANVFLLLTAYYVIKPVREALILVMKSGAEKKSLMSAGIAVALLFAVPAYARFANRLPKNRLVVGVTLFFVSHLVVFYGLSYVGAVRAYLGLLFFLWVGVFNMMVVAQFWAFANDVYSEEQGKRLFALVGLGASLGAAVGSKVAAILIKPLGIYQLLLVSAAMLAACAGLSHLVHRREAARPESAYNREDDDDSDSGADKKSSASGAFALVFKHRYLVLIAAFSLVFTWVNTNGEYMIGRLVKEAALAKVEAGSLEKENIGAYIGSFFGDFYFYVNVAGVLLQTFVVSRLVKHFGLGASFFVLPVIAFFDGLAVAIVPALFVLRIGKIAENATDYSLNNTLRNMLWLPTSREIKYKAKQAVDTFFVRMGDVSSAALVTLGAVLAFQVRHFAIANTLLVAVWLVLAVAIVRDYRKQSQLEDGSPRDPEPGA